MSIFVFSSNTNCVDERLVMMSSLEVDIAPNETKETNTISFERPICTASIEKGYDIELAECIITDPEASGIEVPNVNLNSVEIEVGDQETMKEGTNTVSATVEAGEDAVIPLNGDLDEEGTGVCGEGTPENYVMNGWCNMDCHTNEPCPSGSLNCDCYGGCGSGGGVERCLDLLGGDEGSLGGTVEVACIFKAYGGSEDEWYNQDNIEIWTGSLSDFTPANWNNSDFFAQPGDEEEEEDTCENNSTLCSEEEKCETNGWYWNSTACVEDEPEICESGLLNSAFHILLDEEEVDKILYSKEYDIRVDFNEEISPYRIPYFELYIQDEIVDSVYLFECSDDEEGYYSYCASEVTIHKGFEGIATIDMFDGLEESECGKSIEDTSFLVDTEPLSIESVNYKKIH